MTRRLIGLALLMMVEIAGCAAPSKTPSARPSAFQLFELSPATDSVQSTDLYPPGPEARHFALIDDGGQIGETFVRVQSPTDEYDSMVMDDAENREIEYRGQSSDGDVIMPAHLDVKESAVSLFSPPLVLAPRELGAGEKYTSKASMRVIDRRNPSKVKETGKAIRTIEYVSDQRLRTPLGEFIAKRIEVIFTADMRMAEAEDRITMFVVPERGVIAEQSLRKVKILGAFTSTEQRTVVLMPDS